MAPISVTISLCGPDNSVKPWLELSPNVRKSMETFIAKFDHSSVDPVFASVNVMSRSLTKTELAQKICNSAGSWKKRAACADVQVRRIYYDGEHRAFAP